MLGLEIAAIGIMLGFHWYLLTLAHRKLLESALVQVSERISDLDLSLGEAVEMVTSRGADGQNPIVGVLSEYLAQSLRPEPIQAKVLQGDDGKFVKKTE